MIMEAGEKILVVSRPRFETDRRHHFAGTVERVSDSAVRASGYVFVLDPAGRRLVRRPKPRTRIVSLVDAANLIAIIPEAVDVEDLTYEIMEHDELELTDGKHFRWRLSDHLPPKLL